LNILADLLGNRDYGLEFGHGTAVLAQLSYQLKTLSIWLNVGITLCALTYLSLSQFLLMRCKYKLSIDAKELDRFFRQLLELFLKSYYLFLVVVLDTLEQKSLDFGSFKEKAHDEVIDILVFNKFSFLKLGECLESVDVSDDGDHKLDEDAYFVDHGGHLF
jgi:hypothetical protein